MLPNLAETRDPLNPELLPPSAAKMELGYRTATDREALPPIWRLLTYSFLSTVVLFVSRLLLQLQHPNHVLAVLGSVQVLSLTAAIACSRRGRKIKALISALASSVLIVTLLTPDTPCLLFMAWCFGSVPALWLGISLLHHVACWRSADFRVAITTRRRFLAVWKPAAIRCPIRPGAADPTTVRAREAHEHDAFRQRLAAIIALLCCGFLIQLLGARTLATPLVTLLLLTLVFAGFAANSVLSFCRDSGQSLPSAAMALAEACHLWFGYNRHRTLAAGVLASPAGSCQVRVVKFTFVFVIFCATTSLACSYFSLPLARSGEEFVRRTVTRKADGDSPSYLSPSARARIADTRASAMRRLGSPLEGRVLLGLIVGFSNLWSRGLAATITCAVLPPALFVALLLALCARVLLHFAHAFGPGSPYLREISEWDAAVERLRRSRDKLETEHVWLGVAVETDSPVLMHRQLATEHVHLMGSTGSNKTSIGVTQLLQQLIGPESSVLVLDLKGDMALFEAARLAASDAKDRLGNPRPIRFRWFTTETERSTYVFNPFCQSYMRDMARLERTEILSKALGLEHGEGYGRGHFSRQNRNALLKLLSACPEVDSFRKLHEEGRRQKKLYTSWEREHASDFFSVIHTFANIDALNVSQRDRVDGSVLDSAIDMSELIRQPNILFFRLPATSQSAANREVGKLAIHCLLTAARQAGAVRRQLFIVIDEFQQLVSADLAIILQQARSYGIGVIMAHQTQSDLQLPDANMMEVVEENSHFKQIFSVNDLDHRQALEKLSGEALYHLAGWEQDYDLYRQGVISPDAGISPDDVLDSLSVRMIPQIGPRLSANDLIAMSARQNVCMVQFKRNVGYGQYDGFPFLVRTDYHITREEYQRRIATPWPAPESACGTIVAPLPPEFFFYQVSVEKPKLDRQIPLPFTKIDSPVTNPPSPSGLSVDPATVRNPIAEALDAQ